MTTNASQAQAAGPALALRGAHVALRVGDGDAGIAWYRDMLDMRVARAFDLNGMTFTEMAMPGADPFRIELVSGPGADVGPTGTDLAESFGKLGWHHLGLWVDDVDGTVAELRRRGATITLDPFDNAPWSVRVAFLVDPWNNVIELLQAIEAP